MSKTKRVVISGTMQEYRLAFKEHELDKAAEEFLQIAGDKKHFSYYGSMGVGKTTFITRICKLLGSSDLVSSPTFAIVNEYASKDNHPIYHFDFYRIKSAEELLDIGFYDYCDPGAYIFIEWPEKAEEIIPEDFIDVVLKEDKDGLRVLTFRF